MMSKYAKKVRRLLRKIYPTPQPIIKEVSLGQFSKDIVLSKRTQELIRLYEARLGRMKVDFWVKHQVAVEVHGEQHEQEICFSNEIEDLAAELQRRKGLDLVKQEVLKEAGIPVVIVWYYEIKDLTAAQLKEKIVAAQVVADATKPKRHTTKTTPKISSLGHPRKSWTPKRPTRLGGKKLESRRTIQNAPKGGSKLSRDWKQHKKRRKN